MQRHSPHFIQEPHLALEVRSSHVIARQALTGAVSHEISRGGTGHQASAQGAAIQFGLDAMLRLALSVRRVGLLGQLHRQWKDTLCAVGYLQRGQGMEGHTCSF